MTAQQKPAEAHRSAGLVVVGPRVCPRHSLAVHPAERRTAAAAGAGGLCDAARCFPAASGDAAPRG